MSLAMDLIEKIANQKTAWLKDYDKSEQIKDFIEVSEIHRKRKIDQRERLTVSVINTNSGQKQK